jgi:pimeloyl-ACP methyl ester carboxylesterase
MQIGPGGYPEAVIEAVSPARNVGLTSALLGLAHKPPITWVYGEEDVLVANNGNGSPNEKMVDDMRSFLVQYAQKGGSFEEIVYSQCGHSPFLEVPTEKDRLLATL